MKKVVLPLAILVLVVSSITWVYATQCSFPTVIDCDTIEEVGLIANEFWESETCTYQEYLQCKNIWWEAPEKPLQPTEEEVKPIPIMDDAMFGLLTLSLIGLGVYFCKKT